MQAYFMNKSFFTRTLLGCYMFAVTNMVPLASYADCGTYTAPNGTITCNSGTYTGGGASYGGVDGITLIVDDPALDISSSEESIYVSSDISSTNDIVFDIVNFNSIISSGISAVEDIYGGAITIYNIGSGDSLVNVSGDGYIESSDEDELRGIYVDTRGTGAVTINSSVDIETTGDVGAAVQFRTWNFVDEVNAADATVTISGRLETFGDNAYGFRGWNEGLGASYLYSTADVIIHNSNSAGYWIRHYNEDNANIIYMDISGTITTPDLDDARGGIVGYHSGTGGIDINTDAEMVILNASGIRSVIDNPLNTETITINASNSIMAGGNGMIVQHAGAGWVDITSTATIDAGKTGIFVDGVADFHIAIDDSTITANESAVVTNGGDGILNVGQNAVLVGTGGLAVQDGASNLIMTSFGNISGDVELGEGVDSVMLMDGMLQGDILAGAGDDNFIWNNGQMQGSFFGGEGEDTALILASGYDGSQGLDGGDEVVTNPLIIDDLTLQGVEVVTSGALLSNWERVTLDSTMLTIDDGAWDVGIPGDNNMGVFLVNASLLDMGSAIVFGGNMSVGPGSSLLGQSAGSTNYSITGDIMNSGLVSLQDGDSGDRLTVGGDYEGSLGSVLTINTVLGDGGDNNQPDTDRALTDQLIVSGDGNGQTLLQVVNNAGTGGATDRNSNGSVDAGEGILFAQVQGDSTEDLFVLTAPVKIGAWQYTTAAFSPEVSESGFWDYVLASQLSTSGVVAENYAAHLLDMGQIPTLWQRRGMYYFSQNDQGKPLYNAVWLRHAISYDYSQAEFSYSNAKRRSFYNMVQGGVEFFAHEVSGYGLFVMGITGHYSVMDTNIESAFGNGSLESYAYGGGLTATWYGDNGFYTDIQAMLSRYSTDLHDDSIGVLASRKNANGFSGGIEMGRHVSLDNGLDIVPQGQLIYHTVEGDSFTTSTGERFDLKRAERLQARIGVSLEKNRDWTNENGEERHSQFYGIANIHHILSEKGAIAVDASRLYTKSYRTWGELGVGFQQRFNNESMALYGELSYHAAFEQPGRNHGFAGQVGIKFKW